MVFYYMQSLMKSLKTSTVGQANQNFEDVSSKVRTRVGLYLCLATLSESDSRYRWGGGQPITDVSADSLLTFIPWY